MSSLGVKRNIKTQNKNVYTKENMTKKEREIIRL